MGLGASSGFTLAEILIAIFILSIVMATILGTFTGVVSSAREAETRSELYQTGRSLMDLITTDIRCLFAQTTSDGKRFFRGESHALEGEETSVMSFVTTNALTMGKAQNPFLTEVTYALKKDEDGPGTVLWRRTQSPALPPYDEGGKEIPICRIAERFRLEFISKGVRRKALTDAIPEAVMVELVLDLEGYRETFATMVRPMVQIEKGKKPEPEEPPPAG
jgi:prepilin-type N-terminal cleavage/methylation domain-containing protein